MFIQISSVGTQKADRPRKCGRCIVALLDCWLRWLKQDLESFPAKQCDDEKSRKFHRRTFQDRQAASKGTVKMNKDGERLGIWNRYDDDAKWRSEIRKSMWLKECFELRKVL